MERWINRVAVVTGSSSGIGAAIAVEFTKAGMIVVGLARRVEKIEALKSEIPENCRGNLHAIKCDVSKEDEIIATFKKIDDKFGGISVLVNNAGVLAGKADLFTREHAEDIRNVVNVNILGLVNCTREAYISMKKHNIDDGHIININSIVGHNIPVFPIEYNVNIYPPTKFAVTALTEIYRQDLVKLESKIRVTSISPGLVESEMTENAKEANMPMLQPEDIADAVIYALGTPPHVQIHELIIKPVGEFY